MELSKQVNQKFNV